MFNCKSLLITALMASAACGSDKSFSSSEPFTSLFFYESGWIGPLSDSNAVICNKTTISIDTTGTTGLTETCYRSGPSYDHKTTGKLDADTLAQLRSVLIASGFFNLADSYRSGTTADCTGASLTITTGQTSKTVAVDCGLYNLPDAVKLLFQFYESL